MSPPRHIILAMDTTLTPINFLLAESLLVKLITVPSLTLLKVLLFLIAQILKAHLTAAHQAVFLQAAAQTLLKALIPLMMMILIIKLLLRPIITLTNMETEYPNNRFMELAHGKEPYLVVLMSPFTEELWVNKPNTPSIMETMMFLKFTKITERVY